MKRNLIYHVYPLKNSTWQWGISKLLQYRSAFNNKVILTVATDANTESLETVSSFFDFPGKEVVTVVNDPKKGESKAMALSLPLVKTNDPDEITFYAHSKGVSKIKKEARFKSQVQMWAEAMFFMNLNRLDLIESLIKDYDAIGILKQIKNHAGAPWHFSGTFFWFRSSAIADKDWTVAQEYYGSEGWIGKRVPADRAFSLFDTTRNLYDYVLKEEEYRRSLEKILKERGLPSLG